MRYITLLIALLLSAELSLAQFTTTTNLKLKKPNTGITSNWDVYLNGDMDTLDLLATSLVVVPLATGVATTDTTNIQNALNTVTAGGIVLFPCGTYLINAGLTLSTEGVQLTSIGSTGFNFGGNDTAQCVKIQTTSAIVMLTTNSNGSVQQYGGGIKGIAFQDTSNSGAGGTAFGGVLEVLESDFVTDNVQFDNFNASTSCGTASGATQSTNTVTMTFSSVSAACSPGSLVTTAGWTPSGYNVTDATILTSNATTITFTIPTTGLGASTVTGTATTYAYALAQTGNGSVTAFSNHNVVLNMKARSVMRGLVTTGLTDGPEVFSGEIASFNSANFVGIDLASTRGTVHDSQNAKIFGTSIDSQSTADAVRIWSNNNYIAGLKAQNGTCCSGIGIHIEPTVSLNNVEGTLGQYSVGIQEDANSNANVSTVMGNGNTTPITDNGNSNWDVVPDPTTPFETLKGTSFTAASLNASGKFNVNTNGQVTQANNTTTATTGGTNQVGAGIETTLYSLDQTVNQTASIGSTLMFTTTSSGGAYSSGVYVVYADIHCITGQATTTVGLAVQWNNGLGQNTTIIPNSSSCAVSGTEYSTVFVLFSNPGQTINWTTTAANFTTGAYRVHLRLMGN